MQPQISKMTQVQIIAFHDRMIGEQKLCNYAELKTHFYYLLYALRKIIESKGPTREYQKWANSI